MLYYKYNVEATCNKNNYKLDYVYICYIGLYIKHPCNFQRNNINSAKVLAVYK